MEFTEYTYSIHTTMIGNKRFSVRNLIPKLDYEKKKETEKKIESGLYEIFCKYMAC